MSRPVVPVLVTLITLTGLAFLPTLGGGFVWDDQGLIVHNGLVRDPSRLGELLTGPFWRRSSAEGSGNATYDNLYRPGIGAVYAAQFRVFGDHPFGWHLVSFLTHLACVVLAAHFLHARLPRGPAETRWMAASAGALLFALHPSRNETVGWVSGGTDLFMTLGCLVGLAFLTRDRRSPSLIWVSGAFLAFLFAALCKELALLLPVLLFFDARLLIEEDGTTPNGERRAVNANRGVAAASLATAIALGIHFFFVPPSLDGVVSNSKPLTETFARIAATIGHFVERIVHAVPPTVLPAERALDPQGAPIYASWAVGLGVITTTVVAGVFWGARHRAKARPYAADLLWLALPLVPVLNVLPLNGPTLVAERFLYFPMLGASALAARVAFGLASRGPAHRATTLGLAAALGLVMALVNLDAIERFASDHALWAREVELHPRSPYALTQMATILEDEHHHESALRFHAQRIRVATEGGRPGDAFLPVLDALGTMITATSDADQARLEAIWDAFEQMQRPGSRLEIDVPPLKVSIHWPASVRDQVVSSAPHYRLPRIQLALRIGRLDEALAALESLRRDAPRNAMAWKLTAIAHARKGDFNAALGAIDEARRRLPENLDVEAIAARIAEAARIAGEPAVDEVSAAIRDAHVARVLGAPHAARERLEPLLLADPGNLALLDARITADLSEQRIDLARAVVARSRLAAPERAARLDALEARLVELEARTPRARVLSNRQSREPQ